ncbi:MAG: TraB/GumN family protein [Muribaculaceae bacterium]|nr:TraB/GumN family protein [Muribaculaceae bacterium]
MKKIILSLATLIIALSGNAQIFYKVSGNGCKGDSYVMGTHHLAPISIIDSIKGFNAAINSVDAVYGEIEHSEMNSPATQQKMMMAAMAPADSTLSKIFTKEQFDSIDNVMKKYSGGQATLNMLEPMKPMLVGQQLTILMNLQVIPNFNPMQLLDSHVQTLGAQAGKGTFGLENIDFQINVLFGDPISKQAEDLLETIRKEEKMKSFSLNLYNAYMIQDIEKVRQLMIDPDLGLEPEDEAKMLTNRNVNWVNQLKTILPQKSVFVCVGAGHLPGENGVLNLLRQAGYTITPVN